MIPIDLSVSGSDCKGELGAVKMDDGTRLARGGHPVFPDDTPFFAKLEFDEDDEPVDLSGASIVDIFFEKFSKGEHGDSDCESGSGED